MTEQELAAAVAAAHECARAVTVQITAHSVVIGSGLLDEPCRDIYGIGATTGHAWREFRRHYAAALKALLDDTCW